MSNLFMSPPSVVSSGVSLPSLYAKEPRDVNPQGSRRVVNRCSQVGQVLVDSLVLPVQPPHLVQEPERDGSHGQAVHSERTEQHNQKDFHFLTPSVQHGNSALSAARLLVCFFHLFPLLAACLATLDALRLPPAVEGGLVV